MPADATTTARTSRRTSLGFRIGGVLAIIVGVSFGLHLLINDGRDRLLAQKEVEARKLGDLVIAIISKEMDSGQPERVQEHLDVMRQHRDVHDIRLFSPDGEDPFRAG